MKSTSFSRFVFFKLLSPGILWLAITFFNQVSAQSGNLDQGRNGGANSPTSPVDLVNGNAGPSNSHYVETMSVPYRCIITGLTPGTHYLEIEWAITRGGSNAFDFITHYQRLEPHGQFSHTAEVVNPLIGLTGISNTPVTYAIPVPLSSKNVSCTNLPQPQTAFNALPANERVMTMFNGTAITNIQYVFNSSGNYGDLNASSSDTRIKITFTTTNGTVVFAWGGHMACTNDWCPGNSASGISGSPYHMSLVSVDGGGGSQDKSLSAAAVIPVPPCDIAGISNACPNQLKTFSISPYIGYTYTWSIINNTCGATFSGTNVGASVSVNTGTTAGSFTLNLNMSSASFTGSCSQLVTVAKPVLSETHTNYACGSSTGSVNLSVSGGLPPYTYLWSNGASTEDISSLNAGIYTVTVTDQSCSTSLSVNITGSSALTANLSAVNVSCFGGNNGSAIVNASGGAAPYSFVWSNGATTQSASNLLAGTYTVTVTGANGCSAVSQINVTQPSSALSSTVTASANVSCYGGNNGSIDLTVSGGTGPYSYNWSNGNSNQDLSNISSGAYTVTVTDTKGCTSVVNAISITQPANPLNASAGTTANVSCFGGNNGSITLTVNGGTAPYGYTWNNGATTQNLSNITSGTYTVTVTDAKGCTISETGIQISQPLADLSSNVSTITGVSCFGGNNGNINLIVNGGTAPYSYSWSNGSTSQNLSNVIAGTYSVTVTDAKGCTVSNTGLQISQPSSALNSTAGATTSVSCFGGNNGGINVSVSGGTSPYTYSWNTGSTNQNLTNISAGSYTVVVTDNKGCTIAVSDIGITQPAASLNAAVNTTADVLCFGGSSGAISLNVNGGTSPYNYSWSNGTTTQNLTNIGSGTYTVNVNDANGCTKSISGVSINQPSAALDGNIDHLTNVSCFGNSSGDIDLSVTGGTTPYTYLWNNGINTQDLNNVAAGLYSVTITDANGCTNIENSILITQPAGALIANATTTANVNCTSGANGAISLAVSGGTAGYSFNWNNGATTQNISGLYAGTYVVTVIDNKGCSKNASATVSQPVGSLNSSINTSQNVSCFGGNNGSVNVTINGGTAPYTYTWNNGATTQNLNGLPSGSYTVTITDNNGCINIAATVVNQPSAALSNIISALANVSCFGEQTGAIDFTANGGTTPYTYLWSNGSTSEDQSTLAAGTYTVTVTDAKGCTLSTAAIAISQPSAAITSSVNALNNVSCNGGTNGGINLSVNGGTAPYSYVWSNGANTQNLGMIAAGIYTVTITDSKGCSKVVSGIAVSQPAAALSGNISASANVSCFGGNNGSINLATNGGTSPYSYNWSNGNTSQNISNLLSGTYTVTITDVNGCTTQIAGVNINQPGAALSGNPSAIGSVNCFGGNNGSINLTITGGTLPYTYQWNNGATTQALSNLGAGTYTATVTDAKGCTTQIAGVNVSQPGAALVANTTSTSNVNCFGGNNGNINLNVIGGTAPYLFQWSNGSTSQNISNLNAGNYSVTVTDSKGCITQVSAIGISEPAAPLSANTTLIGNVNCFGGNNGNINLNVIGGTAPYNYQWSNGTTSQNIINLSSGTYTVTVTDNKGCTYLISAITISQPGAALNGLISSQSDVNCFGGNNGIVNLIINGGTTPYIYQWSNGSTSQNLTNVTAGSYSVTVTDLKGCTTQIAAINVSQPGASLTSNPSSANNVSCYGGSNGNINLTTSGGTLPYTYIWSNGFTTQNINNLSSGTYSATITDAKGCTTQVTGIAITQPGASLSANPSSVSNVNCFGGNNGNINLNVSGGTLPYSFQWNNGATIQNLSNLNAGSYTATITDGNGCITQVSGIAITQPASSLSGSPSSTTNVNCFGGNNGSITLIVNGGTAPYSFQWTNGATTQNLTNIVSGTYSVTVTDAKGCIVNVTGIAITQPGTSLNTALQSTTNVNCFGGTNGSISLTVNGGTSPFTYLWNNGATTQNLTAVSAGAYTVTVTDAKNCTAQVAAITISQPPAALSGNVTTTQNVNCNSGGNGSVGLTATGGTAPYTFLWSNGATNQNIGGLYSGTYVVTITDSKGCTTSALGIVSQPAGALASTINVSQNVNCFGGNNGVIVVGVNGGTAPYTYVWNNGTTTQNLNNLSAGVYTLTITDQNGCINNTSATVQQPSATLTASPSSTSNVSCFGGNNGNIGLTINGGTAPYTYQWNNGFTTQNLGNLSSGTYTATVTDAHGCTTQIAGIAISQPAAALSASPSSISTVSCNGGNNGIINLSVLGGTLPYAYLWNNGVTTQNMINLSSGLYTVTITDAKGCTTQISGIAVNEPGASVSAVPSAISNVNCFGGNNGTINLTANGGTPPYTFQWSNGTTSQNAGNLTAGTYSVTVTDANGCTKQVSGIAINQPAASLSANPSSTANVSCYGGNNGNINLSVNGGTLPYTYLWSNGFTTQQVNNLSSGTYSATVTDINGCSTQVTGITVSQPAASLAANPSSVSDVNCFGGNNGNISLSLNGGTLPYTYQWNTGATTQNISNLASGNYTVTVTDVNGCTTQVAGISIVQPGATLTASPSSTTNVSCYGGNNGNINLNVNGGTAPYAYQWNNGATTQNLGGLASGTYTATITDINGCTTQVNGITINQPGAAVTATPSAITSVSCFGGNNGTITLNVNGGTLPYTYQWNNGATTQSLNNIASGTYTATVTDVNGCTTQTNGIAVNQPGASVQASPSSTANVSCYGGNNGNININVNGGTAPYLYLWSNGTTTQNVAGLPSGTYTVNVTDFNGCTTQVTGIAIAQPGAAVSGAPSSTGNVSCYGGNNGAINLTVNGGTLPYVYQWNTGASTQNLSNLNSGTYTATITDANGCSTQVAGIAINQPAASVSAVPSSTNNVNCFGGNNGNINIVVNGGTLPYTYLWNNGATTQNVNSLASGTYTVTVTDVNGCSNEINAININQPSAAVQASPSSTNNVSCYGGNNGDINLNVNGGTAPYSYQWNNGATTQNLSNLASGTYTTTVTDANGCTTQVAGIAVNQPGASLNGIVTTTQNVSCNSGGNGTIMLSANGGTAPYTYLWSNGQTTQNLTGLYSGTYVVTITDVMGCTFSDIGIVSQPTGALASSINVAQNINCYGGNNGSINLAVSGGTSPYVYSWSNGATSQNLVGLPAGSYSVTITDANGCLNITYANVQQPSGALNGNPNSTTNVSCYGGNNGDIVLIVNGGTVPYVYQWSNGETTQNLSNLASGTYTATVTDANGCTTQVAGIAINQPGASVSATPASTTNVNCYGGNNGDINLNVNGGTSPYTYQWNNGATTQNISNLAAGTYTATVTDVNGCSISVAGIAINQPGASVSALPSSTTNVSCYGGNNGDITLNVNGGTLPYTYQWSNGETTQDLNSLPAGTYTVTVTDANGCTTQIAGITINQPGATVTAAPSSSTNVSCFGGNNGDINLTVNGGTMPYAYQWNNGATTQNLSNLASGTYTVTVTDINGCSTQVAGIAINQPGAVLTANPNSTSNVSCYGGNNGDITLVVNGGTLPYTYQWSNGETTQDINNLAAGTYSVTITDINGCTTQVAGIAINQPGASVNASPTSTTNVSCYGGNNGDINLTVNGGTAPYTFQWSNGETTQILSNLQAGTYTATVTDANGCSIVTGGITINQPNAALAAAPSAVTQVSCTGGNNGFIDITTNGGTLPYTYQWSNGASTQSISNLAAGTYTATVTDVNGCSTVVAGIAINQPATLVSANPDSVVNILCYGGNSGSISITANGGTLPYNYQWSNGSTNQNINSINAGNYTVTITDANGCITQIAGIAVTEPGLLTATANFVSGIDCFGGKDGEIDLIINGGTAPYTFSWSNGATTQNNTYLSAGTYTATITDINGCSTIASSLVILQPAAPLTTVVSASQNIVCYGSAIGMIDLSTSNGTAPYSYLWNNGLTTEDINGLAAGVYTATITDAHGCTTTVSATITQPGAGLSVNGTVSNANCLFGITGSVNINTNGGTSPYSFLWNTGGVSQSLSNIGAGSYSVTITDANGCSTQGSYIVIDNSAFNANANGPTEFCLGGSVTLTADSVVVANYQWYLDGLPISGANGNTYTAAVIGNYSVTVINNCGSFSSVPINVNVHNSDSIILSPDVFVCPGESAQINVSGGTTFEWFPVTGLNSSTIPDPVVTPIANTTYTVIVTNDYGCKSTDSVNVEIRCDTLIIPTGYSPNSDGTNDYFVIPGIDKYPGNKIWIYNRWGSLVYETQNYDNKWGGVSNAPGLYIGQKVPASTYFYVLDLNNGTKPRQGYIVIRY